MGTKRANRPEIWICLECGSFDLSFDRSLCVCGMMHYYCGGCGRQDDACDPDGENPYLALHDACGCEKCHPEIHRTPVWGNETAQT